MVLRGEGPLAIGMRLVVIIAAVVEAGFGVLLQLLGQVGSWSTGWDVIFVPILWDLQLFYEAHGSGRIDKGGKSRLGIRVLDIYQTQSQDESQLSIHFIFVM